MVARKLCSLRRARGRISFCANCSGGCCGIGLALLHFSRLLYSTSPTKTRMHQSVHRLLFQVPIVAQNLKRLRGVSQVVVDLTVVQPRALSAWWTSLSLPETVITHLDEIASQCSASSVPFPREFRSCGHKFDRSGFTSDRKSQEYVEGGHQSRSSAICRANVGEKGAENE